MVFTKTGLLTAVGKQRKKPPELHKFIKNKKKSQLQIKALSACFGVSLKLHDRGSILNPYNAPCSMRCRHPLMIFNSNLRGKSEEWIPEDIYKRYTETDSRPISPEITKKTIFVPRSSSLSVSPDHSRKCMTPEPETKQCQFHQRRVLILDLRRVKSVDTLTRQNSITTATSSTYADDDGDNRSSSANPESSALFSQHFSPHNLSVSRSTTTTPKSKFGRGKRRIKERSASPITYERSSSPKILEGLTLPPLHSSVLTLLGQKSPFKSPRNLSANSGNLSASANKQKKLRRHGRKSKREKEDDQKEEIDGGTSGDERKLGDGGGGGGLPSDHCLSETNDDPNETQISSFKGKGELDEDDFETGESDDSDGSFSQDEFNFEGKKSINSYLDESLKNYEWDPKKLDSYIQEIENWEKNSQNVETKFKSGFISMKEDIWLSFPKTWSRESATFGLPSNPSILQELNTEDYLRTCVEISEPRKQLYSMVFQKYKVHENPTGKTILLESAEKALVEVIGRKLHNDEYSKIRYAILREKEASEYEVDEDLFFGICAFAERVFGIYSMEEGDKCFTCSKNNIKDKSRCHKNKKSKLEKADFEYLSKKIKEGKVNKKLASLLQAISNRD